jgi:hypothetical protein
MEEQEMKLSNRRVVALVKVTLLAGVIMVAVTVILKAHTVLPSLSGQAEAQAGTPDPRIGSIYLNGSLTSSVTISPAQSVTISVEATNAATVVGYRGRIHVSFPRFDSYDDADYADLINLWTSSGDNDMEYIEQRPGDPNNTIWYECGSAGYMASPENLLLTGYAPSDWEPGENIHLEFKVKLPHPGTYRVYVRSVAADAASGGLYYYEPISGTVTDQQCRYVYSRTIEVGPWQYEDYLPLLFREYWPPRSVRGVRMQASSCYEASYCARRLDCLKEAGVNTLYYDIRYTIAFYHSDLMPHREFDSLAYLVPEAHARGMEVYALVPSATMGWPEHSEWNARRNYSEVSDDWLDFSLPEARDFIADVTEEIVTNYDVDGILLDYTRWRSAWMYAAGLSPNDISLTVQGVYNRVNAARPVPVTASVYKNLSSATGAGQMWYDWLGDKYIDYVTPMAYVGDSELREILDEWQDSGYFPHRIIPRLSVAWFEPTTTPKSVEEVLHQIEICYDAGATAMTLWDDRYICNDSELVEELGAGGW